MAEKLGLRIHKYSDEETVYFTFYKSLIPLNGPPRFCSSCDANRFGLCQPPCGDDDFREPGKIKSDDLVQPMFGDIALSDVPKFFKCGIDEKVLEKRGD